MKTLRFVCEICEYCTKKLVTNKRVALVGGGRMWQDVAEDGRRAAGREGGWDGGLEVEMLMEGDALTFLEKVGDAFCLEGILDLELV